MPLGDIYTPEQVDSEIDRLLPLVNRGKELPVPRELARSLFAAENMGPKGDVTFRNAQSPKNAFGVSQVIQPTVEGLRKNGYLPADFKFDPATATLGDQIMAGLATIRDFVDRYKTTDPLKIGALYNAGDTGAKRYMQTGDRSTLPQETQGHLDKIARAAGIPVSPSPSSIRATPGADVTPLDAATAQYNSVQQLLPGVMSALFAGNQQVQAAGQAQIAAIQSAGQAAADAAKLTAESTIFENELHRKIMASLGLDVTDPNSAISMELDASANARRQRQDLGKEISRYQGASLFTDPITWIEGLSALPQLTSEYNRLVDVENTADSQVQRLQTIANNAKSLTPAKSADLLRAQADANSRAFLAKAQDEAAKITAQNAAGQAKLVLDMFSLQRSGFHDTLNLEAREAGIEDRRMRMQAKKEADAQKEEDKKLETEFMVKFNLLRKTIAGPTAPDMTFAEFRAQPKAFKELWGEAVAKGTYGNNYAQAIPLIDEFGNVSAAANSGNAAMMTFVQNIRAQAQQLAPAIENEMRLKNPMAKIDRGAAMLMAYDKLYAEHRQYANKGYDKANMPAANPYAIDFDAAAAAAMGSQSQSTISNILKKFKEQAPYESLNGKMTPRLLVNAVRADVVAGLVDPKKAAAELSIFFKQNSDQQYEAIGAGYIGLPRLTDFVMTPEATGNKKIDLFNPATVENYFTSQVAMQRRRMLAPTYTGRGTSLFSAEGDRK